MPDVMRGAKWAASAAVLALLLAGGAAHAGDPPTVERALRKHAPEVLKYVRDQQYKNVGVLKFLAGYDEKALRDNLGVLNRTLADRLEVALVLAMSDDDDGLCILSHASDVVAKAKDKTLTHLTPAGRAAFFEDHSLLIPRAWGADGPSLADAFVTGQAVLAADGQTVRLRLQIFDGVHPAALKTIGDWFPAAVDPRMLVESDVSFVRSKGVKDSEDDTPKSELDHLVAFRPSLPDPLGPPPVVNPPVVNPPVVNPPVMPPASPDKDWDALLSKSPLKVDVLYNGQLVRVQGGTVDTPNPNDKVTFHIKNTDPKTTYGVVLKVNGDSTIEHQTLPPIDCYKWVLAPGQDVTINGFQVGSKNNEEFKVLPPESSRGQEVNYGDNAGVFTLVAFRAAGRDDSALVNNDENRNGDVKAISRGSLKVKGFENEPPANLKTLQDKLKVEADPVKSSHEGQKGLIVAGDTGDSMVRHVEFVPYPREELSLVVRYYQPAR